RGELGGGAAVQLFRGGGGSGERGIPRHGNSRILTMRGIGFAAIAAVWIARVLTAQTQVNGGRTVKGAWDASGASSTKPVKAGTALPATCGVGEQYFKTDAAAGQ